MKKPTTLLESEWTPPGEEQDSAPANALDVGCFCETDKASGAAQQQYGDFVHTLAGSIKERNAKARHGPGTQQRGKERSRKALGRVLQGLMGK